MKYKGIMIGSVAFAVFVWIAIAVNQPAPAPGTSSSGVADSVIQDNREKLENVDRQREAAFYMSQDFVKDKLKSPASAKFEDYDAENNPQISAALLNGDYEVKSHVDSQNGFGALMRSDYDCVLHDNGDKTWQLVSVDLKQRE